MITPRVFVSYSHDSEAHKQWVLRLATDLRTAGVDATLDQWDLSAGQDVVAFMTEGISKADRVLLVCTSTYVQKADAGAGGVGYERLIVTAELVQTTDTKKFLPLLRDNASAAKIPKFLGPRLYVDFTVDAEYGAKLEQIVREIHGVPSLAKPPLGANPFAGTAPPVTPPARVAGPSGLTASGSSVLADEWFEQHQEKAIAGLSKLGLPGSMELRFALHAPVNKSQIELLSAVRSSEIQTFGWPIGVLLENLRSSDRDPLQTELSPKYRSLRACRRANPPTTSGLCETTATSTCFKAFSRTSVPPRNCSSTGSCSLISSVSSEKFTTKSSATLSPAGSRRPVLAA